MGYRIRPFKPQSKRVKWSLPQFLVIMIRFQHRILIYCVIISVVVYKVKVLLIRSNTSTYPRSYEDQYVLALKNVDLYTTL